MQLGIRRPSSHFFSSCLETLPSWLRSSMCSRSETRRCCSNHDSPCVSRRWSRRWSVGTPMRTVRRCLRVKLLREALHRFADRRLVEYVEPIPHATLAWTLLNSNRRSRLGKIRSVSCVPSAGEQLSTLCGDERDRWCTRMSDCEIRLPARTSPQIFKTGFMLLTGRIAHLLV